MLDYLVAPDEDGKHMTDDEILDNLLTFFFAGSETTAVTMVWILYFLTQNDDVMEKLQEEIKSILVSKDDVPTMEQLNQMTYLTAVIKV